jgi:hypothetical protein
MGSLGFAQFIFRVSNFNFPISIFEFRAFIFDFPSLPANGNRSMDRATDLAETKGHSGFVLRVRDSRRTLRWPVNSRVFCEFCDWKAGIGVDGWRIDIIYLPRAPYSPQTAGVARL